MHFAACGVESRYAPDFPLMRDITNRRGQHSQSIFHAALEVDGRGFFKVFRRAGDLANVEAEHHGLGDHLVIEDEIVGVFKQGQSLKQLWNAVSRRLATYL